MYPSTDTVLFRTSHCVGSAYSQDNTTRDNVTVLTTNETATKSSTLEIREKMTKLVKTLEVDPRTQPNTTKIHGGMNLE